METATPQQPSPQISGKNEAGEIIFRLTDQQFEIIRQVTVARELKELHDFPPFQRWCEMMRARLRQIEAQFLDPNRRYEKDVAWLMRERLVGIHQFWDSGMEGIQIALEALANPAEIEEALKVAAVNPADLAGEVEL